MGSVFSFMVRNSRNCQKEKIKNGFRCRYVALPVIPVDTQIKEVSLYVARYELLSDQVLAVKACKTLLYMRYCVSQLYLVVC